MILDTSTLELLAEVSIALAGFSGVVLILGRRSSGRLSRLDKRRLGFLLEPTLSVFFLSLIPLVVDAATVPYQVNLRFCAAAMLAFNAVLVVFGAWGELAMAIYLAGLTVLLLAASFQFYLLLSSVGETDDAV